MTRIGLHDNAQDVFIKLCEGNPGGLTVCAEIYKQGATIDPDGAMGGLGALLGLDTLGIYGSRIWMLYKDVCGQSIPKTLSTLRAHQLGFITESELIHAIDNYGAGINVDELYNQVQERLPNFDQKPIPLPSGDGEMLEMENK